MSRCGDSSSCLASALLLEYSCSACSQLKAPRWVARGATLLAHYASRERRTPTSLVAAQRSRQLLCARADRRTTSAIFAATLLHLVERGLQIHGSPARRALRRLPGRSGCWCVSALLTLLLWVAARALHVLKRLTNLIQRIVRSHARRLRPALSLPLFCCTPSCCPEGSSLP